MANELKLAPGLDEDKTEFAKHTMKHGGGSMRMWECFSLVG